MAKLCRFSFLLFVLAAPVRADDTGTPIQVSDLIREEDERAKEYRLASSMAGVTGDPFPQQALGKSQAAVRKALAGKKVEGEAIINSISYLKSEGRKTEYVVTLRYPQLTTLLRAMAADPNAPIHAKLEKGHKIKVKGTLAINNGVLILEDCTFTFP